MLPLSSATVLWEGSSAATGSVPHVRPAAALAATQASAGPWLQPAHLHSATRPSQIGATYPGSIMLP